MNKKILIAGIIVVAAFGVMSTADNSQQAYHIRTPEPKLTEAIACRDNDFGSEDPNTYDKVPLPASVRTAICGLTRKTFEEQLYEGPAKYADLFGPVYRITIPDRKNLYLYVYQLKPIPWFSARSYRFVLIVHDVAAGTISPTPLHLGTDFQSYCSRPWIRFEDVLGDAAKEILLLTGEHNGTNYNCMHQHILRIESDTNLREVGSIKTGIGSYFPLLGSTYEEQNGYIIRILKKVDFNHFSAAVSYSMNKRIPGSLILGMERYEVDKNGTLQRSAVQAMGDTEDQKNIHKKIIMHPLNY